MITESMVLLFPLFQVVTSGMPTSVMTEKNLQLHRGKMYKLY